MTYKKKQMSNISYKNFLNQQMENIYQKISIGPRVLKGLCFDKQNPTIEDFLAAVVIIKQAFKFLLSKSSREIEKINNQIAQYEKNSNQRKNQDRQAYETIKKTIAIRATKTQECVLSHTIDKERLTEKKLSIEAGIIDMKKELAIVNDIESFTKTNRRFWKGLAMCPINKNVSLADSLGRFLSGFLRECSYHNSPCPRDIQGMIECVIQPSVGN